MAKKELEGMYEKYLKLFMPIWLPIVAIKMMLKEIIADIRKKNN